MSYPISRYLNVHQAYAPSFVSTGGQLAFISNMSGLPQLWKVSARPDQRRPSWPDPLTFEPERVMGVWCSPAEDDHRLIFARDVGGNEKAQLFLLSLDDGIETLLTPEHEEAMHLFGEWSQDGKQILFSANRRHPGLFDLYLQPLGGEARLIWRNEQPGYLTNLTFSPDGERALAVLASSSFHHDLFEVSLTDGSRRQLSPKKEKARYSRAWYAADGETVYLNTDQGSDFLHIAQLDLETLELESFLSPHWDVENLTLSPDGAHLAYTVNQNGAYQLHLKNLRTGSNKTAPLPAAAPGVVAMWDARLSFSPGSNRLAFSFTSATRSSDVFVWDLEANRVQNLTRSSHGGLPRDSFRAPELIHYPTFDNREIPAWFYKPIQDKPSPVIIAIHGGPESQFKPYFHFFIQYFLQHGFAVLAPNVRGSTGYGKAYSHLDDVYKRMDSVKDIAYAARWLKAQPGVDSEQLVVYGGSYGGFMVLAAMTSFPDLWAAGVDIVGISNFVSFLENTSDYRRAHREAEYGSLARDRAFLSSISPIQSVDQIRAPLMVIHGANDPRVPLVEAEQIAQALQARQVPVELLVFEDEGHGLVKLKNKQKAYPAIVQFLEEHLPGF